MLLMGLSLITLPAWALRPFWRSDGAPGGVGPSVGRAQHGVADPGFSDERTSLEEKHLGLWHVQTHQRLEFCAIWLAEIQSEITGDPLLSQNCLLDTQKSLQNPNMVWLGYSLQRATKAVSNGNADSCCSRD